MTDQVSAATVGRLPAYLRALLDADAGGEATVSSEHLAQKTGANPATVRRDLASLGITGTRGVGYDVKYVVFRINSELGLSSEWPVIIVGIGNLGRALSNYRGLSSRGFPVKALVDIDRSLVGLEISGLTVRHLDELSDVVDDVGAAAAIIAVPPDSAQAVADALVAAGIRSILDFTASTLELPDHIAVRPVDLATELQILSFYQQRGSAVGDGHGVPLEHA